MRCSDGMDDVAIHFEKMGRLNISVMRYMEQQHFRVLIAVEMGMKNHELVPLELIASIAGINRGTVARTLHDLCKHSAVAHERGKRYDGYRLTTLGYDMLALKALSSRKVIGAVGNQIGVGKESDVFIGGDSQFNDLVLKFHRLGRTSFRKLKEKRDYHKKRKSCSWLYLSRLAAAKEFAFLKALYEHKFPVPRPVDVCRHLVVMDLINGTTLCNVQQVEDNEKLYDTLMSIIVRLARYGLIHGDFNEFNIMLTVGEEPVMIDLPQMVSMDHPNAQFYFERDVDCVRSFFRRRFNYESEFYPNFKEMSKKHNLDAEVNASGFTLHMANAYNEALETTQEQDESSTSEEEDEDEDSSGLECDRHEVDENVQINTHNIRLNEWIRDAQNELEKLDVTGCPVFDDCSYSMDEKSRMVTTSDAGVNAVKEQEKNEPRDISLAKDEEECVPASSQCKAGTKSVFSIGSTIAPEVIRRRVAAEEKANRKKPLRVKGKANALIRQRKTNTNVVKEYFGWDL